MTRRTDFIMVHPVRRNSKKTSIFLAAAICAGALPGVASFVEAPEAHAITCGYSVHNEDVESWAALEVPWIGNVDVLGGKREFAYWGNCSGGNEKIIVQSANGPSQKCVTPGETKLGQTKNEKKISSAKKVGTC